MSHTNTIKDLQQELSFIEDENTQVFCRPLFEPAESFAYGYQLVFINKDFNEIARIFIRKLKLSGE